jgi:hypothetical protein
MNWDVFISHASEDKETFVQPLAEKLRKKGLKVWYDDFTLKLGDSLRRNIEKGLAESDFGIVVLSPDFFRKEWPQKELNGLVARESEGEKVILPIWHNVSMDDVKKYSPILADRKAAHSQNGLDKVVKQIIEVVKPELLVNESSERREQLSEKSLEDLSPCTYENILIYASQKSLDVDWDRHLPNIYSVYRNLKLHIMAQVREAIEDDWSGKKLSEIYQRLLGRKPDWVGIFTFQPWIFLLRARGIEIIEQSILASVEYRKRKEINE